MSHTLNIVLSSIEDANKWANFFDSVVDIFDDAPVSVQSNLLSVKNSPGFCCCPDWRDFNGEEYDTLNIQAQDVRQYWLVSDTMISAMNTKQPNPQGAVTLFFSPVLHCPDRVQYAYNNMLTTGQTLEDLTPEQLAELAALGNDYYIQMASALWGSFSAETQQYLFDNLGTPSEIVDNE